MPFRNPYEFDGPPNTSGTSKLRKRKHKRPPQQKQKAEDVNNVQTSTDSASKDEVQSVQVIEKVQRAGPGPEDSIPEDSIIRWLKPTPMIVNKIVEDRNKLRILLRPDLPYVEEQLPTNLVYLLILNDDLFDPIDFIFKYRINVNPKEELNSKLKDLVLPKELMEKGDPFAFICFSISATKAKSYNLKLKSRKRRKKKKRKLNNKVNEDDVQILSQVENNEVERMDIDVEIQQNQNPSMGNPIDNLFENLTIKSPTEMEMDINGEIQQQLNVISTSSCPVFTFNPFNPNIHVSDTQLHRIHHSASGKWPADNPITIAYESPNIRMRAINLLSSIFQTNVGNQLSSKTLSQTELEEMEKIAAQILKFHRKLKTMNSLVRNCLTNWIMKHKEKEKLKEERKNKGKAKKEAEMKRKLEMSNIHVESVNSPALGSFGSFSFPTFSFNTSSFASATSYNISNVTMSTGLEGASFEVSNQIATQSAKSIIAEELKKKIPHKCILSTISQILHTTGALKFVGSNKNKKGFMKFLKQSLSLAGMKSSLQLGQFMSLLDPNECSYLNRISNPSDKMCTFAKTMTWLMRNYVLVILRISFHVTESNFDRNKPLYYLTHTWMDLKQELKRRFLANNFMRPINIYMNPQLRDLKKLRYIPKKDNTVRAILRNFHALEKARFMPKEPNFVLKYIGSKIAPHGTSESSTIQEKWRLFLKKWKSIKYPQLYYARVDIKDAYPSVDLNLLAKILKTFVSNNKNRQVYLKEYFKNRANYKMKKYAIYDSDDRASWDSGKTPKPTFLECNKNAARLIDISKVVEGIICKFQCYVQVGSNTYEFNYGLPQGWSLSYALCNIYYGAMEAQHLTNIYKDIDFFVRSVDDYFFVSPNPGRVEKFFRLMKRGFPDYRARINENKSLTNLFVRSDIPRPLEQHNYVQFFGYQFCTTTGHIARDFSGYSGQDICSTITFNVKSTSPERFIFERMGMLLPARLVQPLFDPRINCESRICLNIYEIALMFAFRFYAMCRVVFPNLNSLNDPQKMITLVKAIRGFASILSKRLEKMQSQFHLYRKTKHNCSNSVMCSLGFKGKDWKKIFINNQRNPRNDIKPNEVKFLVFQAFIGKMKKHFGIFKDNLLPKMYHLRKRMSVEIGPKRSLFLLEITGNGSFPPHFRNIKV